MRDFATRALAVVLIALLAGCLFAEDGSGPISTSRAAAPHWLAALWLDSPGNGLLCLQAPDSRVRYLSVESRSVPGATSAAAWNNGLVLRIRLGKGRYLLAGPPGQLRSSSPGQEPLPGYAVSYIERISEHQTRITEIHYYKRVSSTAAGGQRPGAGPCHHAPPSAAMAPACCRQDRAAPPATTA